jgi:NitT/TauT family transport system permease protein
MPRKSAKFLLPILTGILFLELWQIIYLLLDADHRFLVPAPWAVVTALQKEWPALSRAAFNTGKGALLGFALAVAVSFTLAVLMAASRQVRTSLYPYLMILQMTPVIVIAPLLVTHPWVGPGLPSVTAITFLICFFPLVVNTTQGLVSADRQLVELFRMYRATRRQEMFLLRVPAALPYFFTGLRIAATLAPIGALVGDFTAGSSAGDGGGLGFRTLIYNSGAKYAALIATAAVTCVLGFVLVGAVVVAARLVLGRWHDSYARKDD